MPWIESHSVVERHRKTIALAYELGIKPVHASGHLHALWHSAIEQQEDGDLSRWPDSMVAGAAQYEGDAAQFVAALRNCGFLDDGLLHDWLVYAGRYLSNRYRTSNPEKLAIIKAKYDSLTKVCLKSDFRQRDPVGRLGTVRSGEEGSAEGRSQSLEASSPDLQKLALQAHAAFGKVLNCPAPVVVANISDLLGMGHSPDDLTALFTWRKRTKAKYAPQSPSALTDPTRWEQWQGLMAKESTGALPECAQASEDARRMAAAEEYV